MEESVQKTNAGLGFGIAGLVVGIIAIPLSFISCFLWYPILFAGLGLVLAIVGMIMASQNNGKKGIIIAALCVSIVSTGLSTVWYFMFTRPALELIDDQLKEINNELKNEFNKELDQSQKEFENALDEAMEDSELNVDSAIDDAGEQPKE